MNKKAYPIPNQEKFNQPVSQRISGKRATGSFLDVMLDGKEYQSLLDYIPSDKFDGAKEINKAISEITNCTNTYLICYVANQVNLQIKANISINPSDDLIFREMVNSVPSQISEVDILLVTPGGSGEQIAKFVDYLRPRFQRVRFILPSSAMSAGTIFVMSGDDIIMTPHSHIGPTDPQVPNREGRFVPAQSILSLIEEIRERGNLALSRGQQPNWVDLQILHRLDAKEIGSAMNGSKYSIELVKDFLIKYKFASWNNHKTSGLPVTSAEKEAAAVEIAVKFCDHSTWKSHSRGITRDIAWNECKLQITHSETITGLDRELRRFWALMNWIFENTNTYKVIKSLDYSFFRQDPSLINQPKS